MTPGEQALKTLRDLCVLAAPVAELEALFGLPPHTAGDVPGLREVGELNGEAVAMVCHPEQFAAWVAAARPALVDALEAARALATLEVDGESAWARTRDVLKRVTTTARDSRLHSLGVPDAADQDVLDRWRQMVGKP